VLLRSLHGLVSCHIFSSSASDDYGQKTNMIYYSDLVFNLLIDSVNLVHHLHMVVGFLFGFYNFFIVEINIKYSQGVEPHFSQSG